MKVKSAIHNLLKPIRHDMASRCMLETAQDTHTFVTSDGGLLSVFQVNGVKTVPGDPASLKVFDVVERVISLGCKNNGHAFTFIFENDPSSIDRELKDATDPIRQTIDRLNLDLHDVYTDWQKKIGSYCQTERNWMVVYTSPKAVAPEVVKRSNQEKELYVKENQIPNLASAQNVFALNEDLINVHHSQCQSIKNEIARCGVDIVLLDVAESLRQLRYCIDPDQTSAGWKPALHLNRKSPPISLINAQDHGDFWYPKIGKQLFSQGVEVVKESGFPGEMLRLGSRYYSMMSMEVFPEDIEPFSSLFSKTDYSMPWRIAIDIRPGGLNAKGITRAYSKIFGWMGRTNKDIKNGYDYVERAIKNGDTDVGITFMATTWSEKPKELAKFESSLVRAIQTWGVSQVVTRIGDPVAAWCSTLPGFTRKRASVVTCAPLSEVVGMLPLQRPTSPWPRGAALTRSIDGKLMPIQTSSPLQNTWNELAYAPPGSGKSVLLNVLSMAMILSPGLTKLPRIAHLDVGPSGSGVISLLRSALPEGRKHEAQYIKLGMSEEFAINPFDTELGCRKPTQIERDFLVNLLCLFCTPSGQANPYPMAGEMSGLIVDEVYKRFSDKGGVPKMYEAGRAKEVDAALEQLRFDIDPENPPSWWSLVDLLFEAGLLHEATVAQKYAVPVLEDLMVVSRSAIVMDLFNASSDSKVTTETGQSLVDAFGTVISSARREYPVLCGVTKFDVSDARVIILDLNDVAKAGGPEGKKRAALMYMLGRQASTKSFFLSPEMLEHCPDIYKKYHQARIAEMKAEKKAIIYDEFHNTGGISALRRQVSSDMREGRKWGIRVMLSSQILSDFDDDMISIATCVYILKAGTESDVEMVAKKFGLTEGAVNIIRNALPGPQSYGAPFLGYFQTKQGVYSQLFVNTIGPVLNWALTTTPEDMGLRNKLYARIPAADARRILAKYFPGGSCVDELKARESRMKSTQKTSALDSIVDDLMERYYESLGSEELAS